MAVREVGPSGNFYNNQVYNRGTSPISGSTGSLRSKIRTGNIIFAADINLMRDLINGWIGHYHSFDDLYQIKAFGNTGDTNTYSQVKFSNAVSGHSVTSIAVSPSEIIRASTHNTLKNDISVIRNHSHVIDDRTSI